MTAAAPVQSGRSRRIAISAGGLAVLLGALDTYVVVTIILDIMRDVGIPINQIQRSRRSSPAICSATSRRCRCSAGHLTGSAASCCIQVSLAGFALGSVITALSGDLTTW